MMAVVVDVPFVAVGTDRVAAVLAASHNRDLFVAAVAVMRRTVPENN